MQGTQPGDMYRWVNLQQILDHRGAITIAEMGLQIPFQVQRIYYLSHVPTHQTRGAHAHKSLEQVLIPVHGSAAVTLDNRYEKVNIELNDSGKGLYIAPWVWREIRNFSPHAVVLSLVSDIYDENDYIRSYEEFRRLRQDRASEQSPPRHPVVNLRSRSPQSS